MTQQKEFTAIYAIVEPLVSEADPAALGGAEGEYDNQIHQICKYLIEGNAPVDEAMLVKIFSESFPESNAMSLKEFTELAKRINTKVGKLIIK